jgi:YHS domain-containing protein
MKKYILAGLLIVGIVGVYGSVQAADQAPAVAVKAVQVGNKICPVSGEKIENAPGMETVTMEHNGKIYNLCCSMCIKDFKKDPEKYSKIADQEVAPVKP